MKIRVIMLKIFSIKDTKVGFMNPFYLQNNAVAIREFSNGANATQPNAINTNPEDKELWCLGTFDETTGAITSDITFLAKAVDVIIKV